MPKDAPNPNGQPPKQNQPEELRFERSQVICQHCKKEFAYFTIERIDGQPQLRCGHAVITKIKMACLRCGTIFTWNIDDKEVSRMADHLGNVLKRIGTYKSE